MQRLIVEQNTIKKRNQNSVKNTKDNHEKQRLRALLTTPEYQEEKRKTNIVVKTVKAGALHVFVENIQDGVGEKLALLEDERSLDAS